MEEIAPYTEAVQKGYHFKGIDILHALCEAPSFQQNGKDRDLFDFVIRELYYNVSRSAEENLKAFNSNLLYCIADDMETEWYGLKDKEFLQRLYNVITTLNIEVEKKKE